LDRPVQVRVQTAEQASAGLTSTCRSLNSHSIFFTAVTLLPLLAKGSEHAKASGKNYTSCFITTGCAAREDYAPASADVPSSQLDLRRGQAVADALWCV
jgi:hypothetical protein